MKNALKTIFKNSFTTAVGKYCREHKSTLIASGTIGFSLANTVTVFKNSPRIHQIIFDTKDALEAANNDEEKKTIYKVALKELLPLVAPIIIFQAGTIATVIIAKKDSDKKDRYISELTSAAAVASQVIEEYKVFQKEAEKQLGEEGTAKVRDAITASNGVQVVENVNLAPGEIIFRDPYCGHVFKGTKDTVRLACERMVQEARDNDNACAVLNGEYYGTLGIPDDTVLGEKYGYYADSCTFSVTPQFSATEVEVNGTTMPAYDVWLYPSPEFIDD